jgi:hypothetical protein
LSLLILAAGFIGLTACDPGISYVPKDWTVTQKWAKSFGKVYIEMDDIGGLIGSKIISPEIIIHNSGDSPVIIEDAILKAGGVGYTAIPPRYEDHKWKPVAPGEIRKTRLYWEFSNPLYEVLKDPVELHLKLKIGTGSTNMVIPMAKRY